ncbi:MAG TPA: S4 domain-containing protein YaaA [Acholeplasmatales bacterium]|nr:S4 domain-containing protein YaaA [Acholeplasmatales bacterium]
METIKINTEFITLGQFLKFAGIIDAGAAAKAFLSTQKITVKGEPEQRRGRKLYPGDEIALGNEKFRIEKQ